MVLDNVDNDDDDDVHDGSAKDIEDNNHEGAHDIADADNNNEAAADPHLTVEDFLLECKWGGGWWVQGSDEVIRRMV